LRIEGEQKGEKRLAASCHNLLLFSGLRRLRQDLVNFNFPLRRQALYPAELRAQHIDSRTFVHREYTLLNALTLCAKGRRSIRLTCEGN
jgi:hypothetical protein